jgi:hypothetical protein
MEKQSFSNTAIPKYETSIRFFLIYVYQGMIFLLSVPSTGNLIQLLIWFAVAAIVVWAIIALVKWSGVPIPQPVWIILGAFAGIALILFIARLFGYGG